MCAWRGARVVKVWMGALRRMEEGCYKADGLYIGHGLEEALWLEYTCVNLIKSISLSSFNICIGNGCTAVITKSWKPLLHIYIHTNLYDHVITIH